MSITLTIEGNREHVDQHCPEKIEVEVFEADEFYPRQEFKHYPFEVNMSNGNFAAVWRALGLDFDYCGDIHPNLLLHAIKRFKVSDAVRETVVERGQGGCTMIDCGIDAHYVTERLFQIRAIALEAVKRGAMLYWA